MLIVLMMGRSKTLPKTAMSDPWGDDLDIEARRASEMSCLDNQRHNRLYALRGISRERARELFEVWMKRATEGNERAASLIFPYIYGRAEIEIDIKGNFNHGHFSLVDQLTSEQRRAMAHRMLDELNDEKSDGSGAPGPSPE